MFRPTDIPFVPSPNRTIVTFPARKIDLVVLHDMEAPERLDTAENVAAYFARPTTKASAHYCVDRDSIIECVPLKDVAWAAPGANHNGIQIEFAGYARQTPAQWNDAYSKEMLQRGAELTAWLLKRFNIPVKFVDSLGLKRGERGITTHREVSLAFKLSSHTDPGPSFPRLDFMHSVAVARAALNPPPKPVVKLKRVHFEIVNNGKVLFTSVAFTPTEYFTERGRLKVFLDNHISGIQTAIASDPDGSVQLRRKVQT